MTTSISATVRQDASGNLHLVFDPDLPEKLGWEEGDEVAWEPRNDGTIVLSLKKRKIDSVDGAPVLAQRGRFVAVDAVMGPSILKSIPDRHLCFALGHGFYRVVNLRDDELDLRGGRFAKFSERKLAFEWSTYEFDRDLIATWIDDAVATGGPWSMRFDLSNGGSVLHVAFSFDYAGDIAKFKHLSGNR